MYLYVKSLSGSFVGFFVCFCFEFDCFINFFPWSTRMYWKMLSLLEKHTKFLKVKVFYYLTLSPLYWIRYYNEPATQLNLLKIRFYLALQTRSPQILSPLRWKKIYDISNFFQLGKTMIVVWSQEGAWQYAILAQRNCPARTKQLWKTFCVFPSHFFLVAYPAISNINSQLLFYSYQEDQSWPPKK